METRAVISCNADVLEGQKQTWVGGKKQCMVGNKPSLGTLIPERGGEEGRGTFRYPELACCPPEAQSVAGNKGQPWQGALKGQRP